MKTHTNYFILHTNHHTSQNTTELHEDIEHEKHRFHSFGTYPLKLILLFLEPRTYYAHLGIERVLTDLILRFLVLP